MPRQGQEEEHRTGGVQNKVDEVMGPRVQAEELTVQHVGEEGEGVIEARHGALRTSRLPSRVIPLWTRVFSVTYATSS